MSTNIQWTDETWNPIRAQHRETQAMGWHCERISKGCENCYAETLNQRQRFGIGTGLPYTQPSRDKVDIVLDAGVLEKPLRWRKPRQVFVCSMTDLFGEWVPDVMLHRVFSVMALTPHITYQVLTKRPERMRDYLSSGVGAIADWPLPNVWLGVSVEDQRAANKRIPILLDTPAAVRFLSCEPLLGPVDIRQYLGYTPVNENAYQSGRTGLPSGAGGGASDRSRRQRLEVGSPPMESVDGDHPVHSVRAPQGREENDARLFAGAGDAGWDQGERLGPSVGISALQRPDTGWDAHQPPKWDEGGQPAGEPRIGDSLGEQDSCHEGTEEGPSHAGGDGQRHGKADAGEGGGDPASTHGGGATEGHRGGLRDQRPDGFKDRPRASLGDLAPSISWVIVGGESGPGARPCNIEWVRSMVDQCQAAGVPVFVKQLGARPIAWERGSYVPMKLRHSHGGDPAEWPEDLRVREFPQEGE